MIALGASTADRHIGGRVVETARTARATTPKDDLCPSFGSRVCRPRESAGFAREALEAEDRESGSSTGSVGDAQKRVGRTVRRKSQTGALTIIGFLAALVFCAPTGFGSLFG